jgi:hypothetical protein
MMKITWKCVCHVCQQPIRGGRPTILFAIERPMMMGLVHSRCGYSQSRYGQFQMRPPAFLTAGQVSFLVHFYPRFYSLPGGGQPNGELRICLVHLLREYPVSMINPMASFRESLNEQKRYHPAQRYDGDVEADFLRTLGQVQRASIEMPAGTEIDFRT